MMYYRNWFCKCMHIVLQVYSKINVSSLVEKVHFSTFYSMLIVVWSIQFSQWAAKIIMQVEPCKGIYFDRVKYNSIERFFALVKYHEW